mgnify:CR=1 FL=1
MPVIKVKNSTEKYKKIAKYLTHRNELSGRGLKDYMTKQRVDFVKKNLLNLRIKFSSFVDVGCGDGSFLEEFSFFIKKNIGILPTDEEINAVSKILNDSKVEKKHNDESSNYSLKLMKGVSNDLPLHDKSIDLILCNGVLHSVGFSKKLVRDSIKEFQRIQNCGSILYIGEIPEIDEMKDRSYGSSYFLYLLWILKNRGAAAAVSSFVDYLYAKFSSRVYIIQPTNMFYSSKIDFVKLLNEFDYEVIEIFDSNTNEKVNLNKKNSRRRCDYICRKK